MCARARGGARAESAHVALRADGRETPLALVHRHFCGEFDNLRRCSFFVGGQLGRRWCRACLELQDLVACYLRRKGGRHSTPLPVRLFLLESVVVDDLLEPGTEFPKPDTCSDLVQRNQLVNRIVDVFLQQHLFASERLGCGRGVIHGSVLDLFDRHVFPTISK